MAGKKTINFQNGIRNLVRIRYPEINLIPEGIEFLAKLLNGVNDELLKSFGGERKSKNQSFQICAKNAIEKIFKGDLKRYGIAEAQRQFGMLKMGCMVYEKESDIQEPPPIKSAKLRFLRGKQRSSGRQPQSAKEAPTGKKYKSPPPKTMTQSTDASKKIFTSGISKLCTPNTPMDTKAMAFLSNHLCILASRIAKKSAQNAGDKNEIKPKHVKEALTDIMGPETLRTVDAEASRCLSLFKSGLIKFQPKARTKKASKPGSPKSTDGDKITKPTKGKGKTAISINGDVFKPGLKGFFEEFSKDSSIDQDCLKHMQDTLMKIAEAIASQAAKKCERSSIPMGSAELRDAVGEVFLNNDLRHHALVEGTKYVAQFANGMVRYEPAPPEHGKISEPSKEGKKRTKIATRKFVRMSKKRQITRSNGLPVKSKRITNIPKFRKSLSRKQVSASRKKLSKQKGQPRKKVLVSKKRAPRQTGRPGKKVIVSRKKRASVKGKETPAKVRTVVKDKKKKVQATKKKPGERKKSAVKKRFPVKQLLSENKKRHIINKAPVKRMPSKVRGKDKRIKKKLPAKKGLSVKKVFVSKKKRVPIRGKKTPMKGKKIPKKGKKTPIKGKHISANFSTLKRIKKKVSHTRKKQVVSGRTKKPAKKVQLLVKKLPSTKHKRLITKRAQAKRKRTVDKQFAKKKHLEKNVSVIQKQVTAPRDVSKSRKRKRSSEKKLFKTGKRRLISRPSSKIRKTRAVKPKPIKKKIPSVSSSKKAIIRKRSPAKSSVKVKRVKKKVMVARKKRGKFRPVTKNLEKSANRSFAKKKISKLLKKQKSLPEKRKIEPAQKFVDLSYKAPLSQKEQKKSPIPMKSILKRKIDFASGLNEIAVFAFPAAKVKLSQDITTEISKILGDIATVLAVKSVEDVKKRGGRELGADNVRNAALNFLSDELGQHAISRGENVTMSSTK